MTSPIFILAGEVSGDLLASRIMRAIQRKYGQQKWIGVGGHNMNAEGLNSVSDISRLSIIGFSDTLKNYKQLSVFANELIDFIIQKRPKLILTIDAKGFSLNFVFRLKRAMAREGWSTPIVHTVAPTVWAWGSWRRHKFAKAFDGLMCLLPFEPNYFTPLGLESYFIGHPAAFEIRSKKPLKTSTVPPTVPQITLLPGSRLSEINYILPDMIETVALLRKEFPKAIFTLPTLPRLQRRILDLCAEQPIRVVDADEHLTNSLSQCDAVIAASGTVTLQAALYGAPGVACYKTSWFSGTLGRMIVDLRKVILPNAVLGLEVYPFLFQKQLRPDSLAKIVIATLNDPQAKVTAHQRARMLQVSLSGNAKNFDELVLKALDKWLAPSSVS